ncbi:hypothetical protein BD289DRAFT_366458 [Coniella lustricola]|uniref:OTU domain-containing protein n=1 Tax=Coniella lustricola TaxID=2025994 RepID=A0A2T3AB05_9PEZI|nr:hypothetical protein BD289DRAFT_366458 [Coniella lustricola]
MADAAVASAAETLEQIQARHRKEAKDLQGRMTSKKKNATKKTRKGINDECAEMERLMKERHAEEVLRVNGEGDKDQEQEEREQEESADDVAEKLSAVSLTTPQSNTMAPATGATNSQTPGKKRNRQKERLARRAAEQEAAAIAAEQEAATMTDHRGVERKQMQGTFEKHGLREHEIRPDGHCLFSAVADQLAQVDVPLDTGSGDGSKEAPYKTVRRRAAGYIEAHGDVYAGFLEEDLGSYVAKMRDTAEWGGQLELLALANVYGVEIHVVQDRDTEVIQPSDDGHDKQEGDKKRIWLAYYRHGYGLGEHYNSLRKVA